MELKDSGTITQASVFIAVAMAFTQDKVQSVVGFLKRIGACAVKAADSKNGKQKELTHLEVKLLLYSILFFSEHCPSASTLT